MKLWLILSFTTKFSSSIVNKDSFLPKVLPSIQTGNFGLGFEAALSLGTSAPISLHVIHFLYLSYRGRATSCAQVSFNSRPELIIESYELYISTSEPTSARNNNEVSRVVCMGRWTIDPLQLVIGMLRNRHDGEQGCLLFTKIQLERTGKWNTWQLFKKFQWNISRSNGMSQNVFSVFPVVFLFFKTTFDTSLRFSPPFLGKWN